MSKNLDFDPTVVADDVEADLSIDADAWIAAMLDGEQAVVVDEDPYGLGDDPFAEDDRGFYSSYGSNDEDEDDENWFEGEDEDENVSYTSQSRNFTSTSDDDFSRALNTFHAEASAEREVALGTVATASATAKQYTTAEMRKALRKAGKTVGDRGRLSPEQKALAESLLG